MDFGYDSRQILKDVSFRIPEKTSTAIVGPSGSGKTTICSLLARFYDPQTGSITVGGHDLKELTCDSLLSNISMVFQNVYLFHDTIRANICFGKPDATEEEMIAAAKKARCHDFIMALPDGYDTVVGEGGGTLSGGEKQRISIARAMLKDAPIIILDEATASIDPENEHLIQSALSELTRGKTIITIAHRLATIRVRRPDSGRGRRPDRRARHPRRTDAAGRRIQAFHPRSAKRPRGGVSEEKLLSFSRHSRFHRKDPASCRVFLFSEYPSGLLRGLGRSGRLRGYAGLRRSAQTQQLIVVRL